MVTFRIREHWPTLRLYVNLLIFLEIKPSPILILKTAVTRRICSTTSLSGISHATSQPSWVSFFLHALESIFWFIIQWSWFHSDHDGRGPAISHPFFFLNKICSKKPPAKFILSIYTLNTGRDIRWIKVQIACPSGLPSYNPFFFNQIYS